MSNISDFPILIVAYNPDQRLLDSVMALVRIRHVKDIIIVDNSTSDNEVIRKCQGYDKVKIIGCGGNKGIAFAQNIGVKIAKDKGYSWVLTLDHDTVIKESLICKYQAFIRDNECSGVGILATDYYDIGSKKNAFDNVTPIDVDLTISSGSLINIDVFDKIGGFKSYYFIDQVDNEYCYRLRRVNKRIVILPDADMEHRLGNTIEKKVLGTSFYLYDQNPIRTYYRTRNLIWFMREYDDKELFFSTCVVLLKDFVRLSFEKQTFKKYIAFLKGGYHGVFRYKYRMNMSLIKEC